MNCINFDQKFEQYMSIWVKNNSEKYKNNMDIIEGMMPEVYMEFLNRKATWLGGKSPTEFFEQYDDAQELIAWMCTYYEQKVSVPDLLLERITALGSAAEDGLLALLKNSETLHEVKLTAISLLCEMESCKPLQLYVEYIADMEEPDEMGDMCAEALTAMGDAVVEPILQQLDGSSEAARDVFADILSNYPGDERIYELLMERFSACEDKRALFASYLAKLGDERALPTLNDAAQDERVNYLDYVEIVNAIEALGGDRPPEREFAGDPYYESLKQM